MKRFLLIFVSVALLAVAVQATDALYHNTGTVICDDPPQVDASVFLNDGSFCAQIQLNTPFLGILVFPNTALPYTTQNTLWFTNNGLMQAGPGFQLEHITDDGIHHPAASIVNNNGNQNNPATLFGTQFLLLSATNLINRGLFEVGGSGLMQLKGNNVNLSRSGVLVDAAGASGGGGCFFDFTGIIDPTNYFPEIGLDDIYWGVGTVTNLASDQIAQLFGTQLVVQSPTHTVTNLGRPMGFGTRLAQMVNPAAFILTNIVVNGTNTNYIAQAVFVGNLDPNISAQVRFVDNTYPDNLPPGNGFRAAIVEMTSQATNVVSGGTFTYSLYLTDQLAASTNRNSLTNVIFGTQRPAPYILNTAPPCDFFFGATGPNTTFTNALLYDPATFSNRVVAADYAGYAAGVFLATAPTGFPFVYPTNSPGRVEITASNLDLSFTRIRGETIVTVKTANLTGSTGALIEAPNLNYDLGSTNGLLSVSGKDLLKFTQVQRFGGILRAWSAVWTNFASLIVTNGTGTNAVMNTNQIEINLHVLLVDGGGLATVQPALLNDFSARGTNIVLNDTLAVGGSFTIDGENLTVNGAINLSSPVWASTNVHLKTLTNNGTIGVSDVMELGNDSRPYASVVNNISGTISAVAVSLNADSLQNSGAITANGLLTVNTRSGKFEGGQFSAGGDLIFSAHDLKLTRYQQSSVACYMAVTNSLTDSGVSASNILTCYDGFNLQMKPKSGDLFGTTLRMQAPQFRAVNNTWAAEDRGLTAAGFSDNATIGRLIIDVPDNSFMTFSGTGASNALYVDFLDLRSAARNSLQSALAINTNLIIYFAIANVPAESLDGQFADSLAPGGRLRWVRTFAGPNSSVDVLMLSGQTIQTNRALRFSQTIDSDGDGVANAFDFYPFDDAAWNSGSATNGFWSGVLLTGAGASRTVALSWSAAPGTVYQMEFTTNLAPPNWQPLSNYTSLTSTNGILKILDTNLPAGELQRYYRMRYGP